MDYSKYTLAPQEMGKVIVWAVGFVGTISYLFYNTWGGLLAVPFGIFIFGKREKRAGKKRRKMELAKQFLEAIQVVSNALSSGYSMENAWIEAEKEMQQLHGTKALMTCELHHMNHSLGLNESLEHLLEDFAQRSEVEDICNFSEVFSFAKKSGGDLIHIIETTAFHMRAKFEVENEIDVLIASKRLEQKIMNVIPIFLLAYLRLSSFDYIKQLYGNLFGILFMTVCLGVYVLAIVLAERIMNIQV